MADPTEADRPEPEADRPEPEVGRTRCGFVALIGAPNAGKSTLLNALVGSKVSIVSHKVQTTRAQVRGLAIEGDAHVMTGARVAAVGAVEWPAEAQQVDDGLGGRHAQASLSSSGLLQPSGSACQS